MQHEKLPYINLGCGKRIDSRWVNVDMAATEPGIEIHDLTKKLPFRDKQFKVVYHSHVLEHIPKDRANHFILECYRLLDDGGILRIAVPDLEVIARNYLKFLEKNLQNPDEESVANYDWTMIELYDQAVRQESGGEMKKFLERKNLPNRTFIESRSAEALRLVHNDIPPDNFGYKWKKFNRLGFKSKMILVQGMLRQTIFRILPGRRYYRAGAFRLGGEVHQWMYDRFSLGNLLKECGFKKIEVKTAFTSNIKDWTSFSLDTAGEVVLKPDSLFMEGIK